MFSCYVWCIKSSCLSEANLDDGSGRRASWAGSARPALKHQCVAMNYTCFLQPPHNSAPTIQQITTFTVAITFILQIWTFNQCCLFTSLALLLHISSPHLGSHIWGFTDFPFFNGFRSLDCVGSSTHWHYPLTTLIPQQIHEIFLRAVSWGSWEDWLVSSLCKGWVHCSELSQQPQAFSWFEQEIINNG